MKKLVNSNVILNADKFNPTLFSQIWLDKQDIIGEAEMLGEQVVTPVFVLAQSANLSLQVWPERIQITQKDPEKELDGLIYKKALLIAELLPHTPYKAAGINFTWHIQSEDPAKFSDLERSIFWKDSHLYEAFNATDARFGAFLARNYLGVRLNLEIRPLRKDIDEALGASFNFHVDLSERDSVQLLRDTFGNWFAMRKKAEEIAGLLEGYLNPKL